MSIYNGILHLTNWTGNVIMPVMAGLFFVVAIAGQFLGRLVNRDLAGLPMSVVLEWGVPVIAIPALMLFKYGKQRHYFSDFIAYRSKPHVYSAHETNSGMLRPYLKEDEPCRWPSRHIAGL